jgi:triosephosphate isomerase
MQQMRSTDRPIERRLAIGNWKLHMTLSQTRNFFTQWNELSLPLNVDVGFAVPFTAISLAAQLCQPKVSSKFWIGAEIGAQDCAPAEQGAMTGEVSAEMVKEAGARFVILGHSERRRLFAESNALIRDKIRCAVDQGLHVILCCGESREELESGRSVEVVCTQLQECLRGLSVPQLSIAYEPVWAIGSQQAATSHQLAPLVERMRDWGRQNLAEPPMLLYGGSVTPENAAELVSTPGLQGVLVGGPSTDPLLFHRVVQAIA